MGGITVPNAPDVLVAFPSIIFSRITRVARITGGPGAGKLPERLGYRDSAIWGRESIRCRYSIDANTDQVKSGWNTCFMRLVYNEQNRMHVFVFGNRRDVQPSIISTFTVKHDRQWNELKSRVEKQLTDSVPGTGSHEFSTGAVPGPAVGELCEIGRQAIDKDSIVGRNIPKSGLKALEKPRTGRRDRFIARAVAVTCNPRLFGSGSYAHNDGSEVPWDVRSA
ncbi:hypothetical protein FB451DRAFT_1197846 [Mycena latifolia]|nr:hypothetical protein FB451DRAFT_1197846 [Mycena latifolia]